MVLVFTHYRLLAEQANLIVVALSPLSIDLVKVKERRHVFRRERAREHTAGLEKVKALLRVQAELEHLVGGKERTRTGTSRHEPT